MCDKTFLMWAMWLIFVRKVRCFFFLIFGIWLCAWRKHSIWLFVILESSIATMSTNSRIFQVEHINCICSLVHIGLLTLIFVTRKSFEFAICVRPTRTAQRDCAFIGAMFVVTFCYVLSLLSTNTCDSFALSFEVACPVPRMKCSHLRPFVVFFHAFDVYFVEK